jgi:hypothetical protein
VASLHTWKHLPRNKICDLGHIRKSDRLRFQAITTLSLCGDGAFVCVGGGVGCLVFGLKVGMTYETLGDPIGSCIILLLSPNLKKC